MRLTSSQKAPPASAAAQEPLQRQRAVNWRLAWGLILAASVIAVAGQFLFLYLRNSPAVPLGFDTPQYLWRANVVADEGLGRLAESGTDWFRDHADRPGYPVLAATIQSVTGVSPFDLAFVLPAVMATLIGLAAGTFAVRVLREPLWAFFVYAVIVGVSINVALTAPGLSDNLIVDAVVMAAATTALLVSAGMPTTVATVLLMVGAALIHWPFAVFFMGLMAVLTAALVPDSFLAWRRGERLMRTPAGRLGMALGASGAAMVASLGLMPVGPSPPRVGPGELVRKLRARATWFQVPIMGPAAVVGAGALLVRRDRLRLRGTLLMLVWGVSAAAGVFLLNLGVKVPGHRLLGFALGVPVLAAAAVTGVAAALGRWRRWLRPVAVLVVLAALAGGSALGHVAWSRAAKRWITPSQLVQAELASGYLEHVGNEGPVVFVINPFAAHPGQPAALSFRVLRAGLSGSRAPDSYIYLGDPSELMAGRPTLRPERQGYDRISLRYWVDVEPVLPQDPIVLLLPAFNHGLAAQKMLDAGTAVEPGLFVVQGPIPPGWNPEIPAPPQPASAMALVGRLTSVLALLWVVGLGWAILLLPLGWGARVALAPTVGVSALVLGGVAAGRLWDLGFSAFGPWVAIAVATLGWGLLLFRILFRRRRARLPSS